MAEKKTSPKTKAPNKKSVSSSPATMNQNNTLPADTEPVSTSAPVGGTARNAVIEGNEAMNLDEVRRRAYELYEERGGIPGNDAEDWFRAEQELRSRRSNNGNRSDDKKSA